MPKILYAGVEGDRNVMVMELLGPNIEELRVYCGGKLNLQTTLMLADQMVFFVLYSHIDSTSRAYTREHAPAPRFKAE